MGESTGKISFNGTNSSGLPAVIDLDVAGGVLTSTSVTYAVVDTATNTTTVLATPGYIYGISVTTTLSAHTVVIKDGSTAIMTIAASTAAGANFNLFGVHCLTSIVVDPDDSSTGALTIFYRAA